MILFYDMFSNFSICMTYLSHTSALARVLGVLFNQVVCSVFDGLVYVI